MTKAKCCKTCIYSRWWLTAKGNIHRHSSGRCLFKVVPPVVPISIRDVPDYRTTGIAPDDGGDCPVYERNEGPPISETDNH